MGSPTIKMFNKYFIKKEDKGFSLTELLIVVSIIVFLAALIVFYLRTQVFKGNDTKRKGDIHTIRIAMEEYEKDHDCYPTPDIIVCKPGLGLIPYLNKIPCNPTTKASYFIEVEDSTCPSWYRIYVNLENVNDPDINKVGCTWGCGPDYSYNYYVSTPNAPNPLMGSAPDTSIQTEEPPSATFYGCIQGICRRILWDSERPGPECDPNYQNATCYGQCGEESKECRDWRL